MRKSFLKAFQKKEVKMVSFILAVMLVVSGALWNTVKVSALEIKDASTNGFAVSGMGSIADGKIQGTSDNKAYIGVYVSSESSDERFWGSNLKWSNNGSVWSNDSGKKILFDNSKGQSISAYYPYVDNYTEGGITYKIREIQSADTMKEDDLMYAKKTDLKSEKVSLAFDHLMTKISLDITIGSEIQNGNIKSVQISGLASEMTFYPENGTINTGSDMTGSTYLYSNGDTYDGLIFPSTQSTFTVIVVLDNDKKFITTVNCPEEGLKSGHQYVITMQVGQDTLTVNEVFADEWKENNGGSLVTE